MSSELTGEDAFDRVLEAAMDGRAELRLERDSRYQAESKLSAAATRVDNAEGRLSVLEREKKSALPRLAELWQAANAVSEASGLGDVIAMMEPMTRLREALKKAANDCDEIPF